jgi:hypothetical protein
VDLLESGLQEYMTAINYAVDLRPVIKDKINRCNCHLHQSDVELEDNEAVNNGDISFDDLLKLNATKKYEPHAGRQLVILCFIRQLVSTRSQRNSWH